MSAVLGPCLTAAAVFLLCCSVYALVCIVGWRFMKPKPRRGAAHLTENGAGR